MKKISKEVKIGVAVILSLAMTIFGVNWLKGINLFQPKTFYYIKFSNVGGLTKSSSVFADGFRVGIVRDIEYTQGEQNNIVVQIEIKDEVRIPKGSVAELVSEMMGGMHIDILMANNPRERIEVGDTISGVLNKGIMSNVANIAPKIEELVPKIDSILVTINGVMSNEKIQSSLANIEKTTANLAEITQTMKQLINSDIKNIANNMNIVSSNFVHITDELKKVEYSKLVTQIDQTLKSTKAMIDNINNSNGTIGLLLKDRQLYDNLNSISTNANALIKDLKQNPKRYVHFSIWGRKDKEQSKEINVEVE